MVDTVTKTILARIARGSLNETRHWLRRAYTRNLLTSEQINKIQPIIDELVETRHALSLPTNNQ